MIPPPAGVRLGRTANGTVMDGLRWPGGAPRLILLNHSTALLWRRFRQVGG